MKKNNLLLVIDPQNDFCLPNGALYVPNAENDMLRLATFIKMNCFNISQIIVSVDTHHVLDISQQYYWRDDEGNIPAIYTQISYIDIKEGKWTPCFEKEKTIQYIKNLEKQGEFPHIIWPEHCIVGSSGAAITNILMDEMKNWARKTGEYFQVIEKGINPTTEMFGIFRANIPEPENKCTMENKELINKINKYDRIIVAGEAKSHCVANSIKQLFGYPDIMKKIILLDDCMSNVAGFDTIALPIYDKAQQMGVTFEKSINLTL